MTIGVADLIAPARPAMVAAGALTAVGAVLSITPYVALTTMAGIWLGTGSAGPDDTVASLWSWAGIGLVGLILSQVCYLAGLAVTHVAEAGLRHDLRTRLVAALGRVPLGRVASVAPGTIRKIVCDDTRAIHTLVAHVPGDVTNAVVSSLAGLAYLLWVDWRLTLALLAAWLLVVGTATTSLRGYGDLTARFGDAQSRLAGATVEMLEGIKEIKNFQATDTTRTRFDAARTDFADTSYEWSSRSGRGVSVASAFLRPAVVLATLAPLAVLFVTSGWIAPADTLAFFLLALGLPQGLIILIGLSQSIYESRQAAASTAEILSIPAMPQGTHDTGDGPDPGTVHVDHVTFGYDPACPVLHDVSLTARPGTVTALVGPSGGGKTTLARLIARFHDVDAGSVTVGGVDVRGATFSWLLSRVAVVLQDVALTHDTVAANIALGRPGATVAQIEDAARAACIHDRIVRLPHGYDTVVGDEGGILSGGERQRITLARAYLQDAPILVLDEATAQADPRSEREIHAALSELARGRTVIVIAHRLATIRDADTILVVEDGRIVEEGRHDDLVAADGRYAALWRSQDAAALAAAPAPSHSGQGE